MARCWLRSLLLLSALMGSFSLHAQYYDQGRSPQSIRWKQAQTTAGRLIYPDYHSRQAARIAAYLDTLTPAITYGFSCRPLRVPILLHTQNMEANGLVIWAPKRMELLTIPDQRLYAEPWLKQLTAHEYRHAVQYGNLYQGFMKPLGWFVGEQAGLLSSVLVPLWFLEGDATMAETQSSSFGRALQPSFTIEYRAYLTEGTPRRFRMDKWFCGSYRDFIPNHYQLGYQLAAWSRERYGDDMWDRITRYVSHRPYVILTTHFALKTQYDTKTSWIFRETFDDLRAFWRALPQTPDSGTLIPSPITSYTTYDTPMPLGEGSLLAFKKDFDRPNRLVEVDSRTGSERTLIYTGSVSTPPVLRDSVVWWTEYRSDLFWEQRVFSKACGYDLRTGRRFVVRDRKNALYATPLPGGELVTVGYDYTGGYSMDLDGGRSLPLPDSLSIHGMAWDDLTETLVLLGLGDRGMAFYRVDLSSGDLIPITRPSHRTVYNLRAGSGRLSYNSIASGKDEVHLYDLVQEREYQLSHSRYGSFSPSAPGDSTGIYFTIYTPQGYLLAHQTIKEEALQEVPYSRLPRNVVNPPRRTWPLPDMNTIETLRDPDTLPGERPYRKNLNLFHTHSWIPMSFDPYQVGEEDRIEVNFGATLMSQDLLSSTTAALTYGYSAQAGNLVNARINYGALAPKFEVSAAYSQQRQLLYGWDGQTTVPLPDLKARFEIDVAAYLPMMLSSGYHLRQLTPKVNLIHQNSLIYNPLDENFDSGLSRMLWQVNYTDQTRMAYRDVLPRWGYTVEVASLLAPFRNDFGTIYSLYGRAYTPGVAPHHSLTLRGALQSQSQGVYNFYSKAIYPRGCDYTSSVATRYGAFSVDYQLPLGYPDWGINSVVYFNRIRLKAYYDRARYRGLVDPATGRGKMHTAWSYGGEIFFDMRVLRMPVNDTSVGIYLYNPSDRQGVEVGLHLNLPL